MLKKTQIKLVINKIKTETTRKKQKICPLYYRKRRFLCMARYPVILLQYDYNMSKNVCIILNSVCYKMNKYDMIRRL